MKNCSDFETRYEGPKRKQRKLFTHGGINVAEKGKATTPPCAAAGALAFTSAGHMPIYLDVAPRGCAVLWAFGNSFATIPGIVGVAVTGWLVDVTGTYSAAFALTAIVSAVGALAFGVLADSRPIVEHA